MMRLKKKLSDWNNKNMAVWRNDSRLSGFDSHAGGNGDEIKLPSVAIRPPELRMAVQSHGQFERRKYERKILQQKTDIPN